MKRINYNSRLIKESLKDCWNVLKYSHILYITSDKRLGILWLVRAMDHMSTYDIAKEIEYGKKWLSKGYANCNYGPFPNDRPYPIIDHPSKEKRV